MIVSIKTVFLSIAVLGISFMLYNVYHTPPLIPVPSKVSPAFYKCHMRPRLAYYISDSTREIQRLKRLLQAVYHPYNFYIVQLDEAVSSTEHRELSNYIHSHPFFTDVPNIKMIGGPRIVLEKKLTKVANVLHVADILLKEYREWDWFINLDASDYPIVTQHELLYVLSCIPRHLNFIHHAHSNDPMRQDDVSYVWKRVMQILNIGQRRHSVLFAGSPWMALSRSFIAHCKQVWDNLPQSTLFMYDETYEVGSVYSDEDYFQTLICKSREFSKTIVNTDLRYTARDDSWEEAPRYITEDDFGPMLESNALFARMFNGSNSSMLDLIDRTLLHREPNTMFISINEMDKLPTGPGVKRLQQYFEKLVHNNGTVLSPQCEIELYGLV